MLPLYRDPGFTFRFADDRVIPRFHLEGVETGRQVTVHALDGSETGRLLAIARVGDGGWVDVPEPIIMRAGEAFLVIPESQRPTPERCSKR